MILHVAFVLLILTKQHTVSEHSTRSEHLCSSGHISIILHCSGFLIQLPHYCMLISTQVKCSTKALLLTKIFWYVCFPISKAELIWPSYAKKQTNKQWEDQRKQLYSSVFPTVSVTGMRQRCNGAGIPRYGPFLRVLGHGLFIKKTMGYFLVIIWNGKLGIFKCILIKQLFWCGYLRNLRRDVWLPYSGTIIFYSLYSTVKRKLNRSP